MLLVGAYEEEKMEGGKMASTCGNGPSPHVDDGLDAIFLEKPEELFQGSC